MILRFFNTKILQERIFCCTFAVVFVAPAAKAELVQQASERSALSSGCLKELIPRM